MLRQKSEPLTLVQNCFLSPTNLKKIVQDVIIQAYNNCVKSQRIAFMPGVTGRVGGPDYQGVGALIAGGFFTFRSLFD